MSIFFRCLLSPEEIQKCTGGYRRREGSKLHSLLAVFRKAVVLYIVKRVLDLQEDDPGLKARPLDLLSRTVLVKMSMGRDQFCWSVG